MFVYLCRHGEAVDGHELRSDESRFLTAVGRQGAAEVGRALRGRGDVPDLILTSPLVRAVQTAELLAQATGYQGTIEVLEPLAPGGSLGEVLDELQQLDPTQRIFIVGHEPQMGTWTAQLLNRPAFGRSFAKGGVARVEWPGSPERGTAQPGFFLSPQQLQPVPL